MRILLLVFLWISSIVGILIGGGLGAFTLFGPDAKEMSQATDMVSTWRKNAKGLDADGEKELAGLEEKILTARVYAFGGMAVAVLCLALLIAVLAKKGGVPVLAGLGLLTAIALEVLAPSAKEKKGIIGESAPMAVAALCGFGADRMRRKASP